MLRGVRKMTTRRYALDGRNRKVYIGSTVNYNNRSFLVEDIQYLSWNTEQYLTLVDRKNKNKKLEFISPIDVRIVNIR